MALSVARGVAEQDVIDGVQLLYQSAQFFDQALKQFRICHDLCVSNDKIVEKPAVFSMDHCAVKFRQIASYCATLSEKVASVWCGTCVTFYRNLEKIQDKNPSKLLSKISSNGKELAQGFRHLSDCSQTLSSKFLTLKVGGASIQSVQGKYVQAFKEEQQKTEAMQMKSRQELEDAKKWTNIATMDLEYKESYLERAKRAARNLTLTGRPQDSLVQAEYTLKNAKEREAELQEQVNLLEKKLAEQATQTQKAELVASEITKLMRILHEAAEICKVVGDFFESNSENFSKMSAATTGKQLAEEYQLTVDVGQKQAESLAKQKDLLEKYHRTMSIVSSSYNFQPLAADAAMNSCNSLPEDLQMQSKLLEGLGINIDFRQ